MSEPEEIECAEHGPASVTFVCRHLIKEQNLDWYSAPPIDEDPWPSAWCGLCHPHFVAQGEWNEASEAGANLSENVKVLCNHCYEGIRAKCRLHFL